MDIQITFDLNSKSDRDTVSGLIMDAEEEVYFKRVEMVPENQDYEHIKDNEEVLQSSSEDQVSEPVQENDVVSEQIGKIKVDVNGKPWHEEIHRKSKILTMKGFWYRKKGVLDSAYNKVYGPLTVIPRENAIFPEVDTAIIVAATNAPQSVINASRPATNALQSVTNAPQSAVNVSQLSTNVLIESKKLIDKLLSTGAADDPWVLNLLKYFKKGSTELKHFEGDIDAQQKMYNHLKKITS